jgi:hypothetical protein
MDKTWTLDIEAKKHVIELEYPVALKIFSDTGVMQNGKDGKLVVDGTVVTTFASDSVFPPKQIGFEIAGKPAALRKKGLFSTGLDLFFDNNWIKASNP